MVVDKFIFQHWGQAIYYLQTYQSASQIYGRQYFAITIPNLVISSGPPSIQIYKFQISPVKEKNQIHIFPYILLQVSPTGKSDDSLTCILRTTLVPPTPPPFSCIIVTNFVPQF